VALLAMPTPCDATHELLQITKLLLGNLPLKRARLVHELNNSRCQMAGDYGLLDLCIFIHVREAARISPLNLRTNTLKGIVAWPKIAANITSAT
jgi:hypothetical protein